MLRMLRNKHRKMLWRQIKLQKRKQRRRNRLLSNNSSKKMQQTNNKTIKSWKN